MDIFNLKPKFEVPVIEERGHPNKGTVAWNRGKKNSEETRAKLSKALQGSVKSTTKKYYGKTIKEWAEELEMHQETINYHLKKGTLLERAKYTKKEWALLNQGNHTIESRAKISAAKKNRKVTDEELAKRSKGIASYWKKNCIKFDGKSLKELSEHYQVTRQAIMYHIKKYGNLDRLEKKLEKL